MVQLSTLSGMILLFVLCWNDFKDKVIRPRSNLRYFSAYALFMLVNMAIYFSLLAILKTSPIDLKSSSMDIDFQPILIGFMYFGAGAAKFRIAGKEIALYQKVIDAFKVLFRMGAVDEAVLWDKIKAANVEYEKYVEAFQVMEIIARECKSEELVHLWKDVENDRGLIDDQIAELDRIEMRITAEFGSGEAIIRIVEDIEAKKKVLREQVRLKLHKFIVECIAKNVKSEKDRDRIVSILITDPPPPPVKQIVTRAVMTTFLFGLTFGPIFSYFQGKDPIVYSWIGACSFAVFGLIFALLRKAIKKNQAYLNVFSGGIAGGAAFIAWKIFSQWSQIGGEWLQVIKNSVIGMEFGAMIGFLICVLGPKIRNLIKRNFLRYAGLGVTGGLAFFALAWMVSGNLNPALLGMLPMGTMVLVAMADAFDIFAGDV